MKALVYTGPESLAFRDAPDPEPAEGEVVLQVESVGVCGSDMHAYLGHDDRRPAPLILGHEAAGTVLTGRFKGRRATLNPLVGCGICADCKARRSNLCTQRQIISMPPREGAFAEKLRIPEDNLVFLPDGFDAGKAALTEPMACGWHAVRLAHDAGRRPIEGSRCLVQGGGAIGLSAALCLDLFGAGEIWVAETAALRRDTVAASGPFKVFDPLDARLPHPDGFDHVIDAVGFAATRASASQAVRPGGTITHIGLGQATDGIDIRRLTLQEIAFLGAYTYTMEDFRNAAQAIFDGRLGALDWTETLPLAEGEKAFSALQSGKAEAAKFLLVP